MKIHATPLGRSFLILFFLSFFFSFSQQKVEQYDNNGLSTTIFNISLGKITVYLPNHADNQRVSGTIALEVSGNSEKKQNKNRAALNDYKLSYAGRSYSLKEGIIPNSVTGQDNTIRLLDERGRVVSSSNVPLATGPTTFRSTEAFIPNYMIAGEVTKINANCDGDLRNNSVIINGSRCDVLAESNAATFFKPPRFKGVSEVVFNNDGLIERHRTHILDVQLGVGKSKLLRGEQTDLRINISGLSGLEETVPMQIRNDSPAVITLEGGNYQEVQINPSVDSEAGVYSQSLAINSIENGGFSITVTVVPPEFQEYSNEEELLCNCYLNGQSQLISYWACQELGGSCSDPSSEDDTALEDDISPPDFDCDIPAEITAESDPVIMEVSDRNEDIVAISFSYRPLGGTDWELIGYDNSPQDGLNTEWRTPLGEDGVVEILSQVVNKNDVRIQNTHLVYLNVTPEATFDSTLNISYSVSDEAIERARARGRATGDRINEEEDKISELRRKYWDAYDSLQKNRKEKESLIKIDEVLDRIPKTYKDSLKAIVDSISALKKQLPAKVDTTALNKAVDDAQQRLDDCKKRLEELKKEQTDLEKERDRLKEELDKTLQEIDELFTSNGWTGGFGYHSDGRPWFGYVGGEDANTDIDDEKNRLKKKIRELKKPYLKALRRLEELPQEIADAEAECDELEKALVKAKNAKEKGDQYEAAKVDLEDKCREIKGLLRPIWSWCLKHPAECTFKEKLRKLLEECPEDEEALNDFWDEFDEVVKEKKEQEAAYADAEDDSQAEMDKVQNDIKNAEDNIKKLKEQQEREYAEAERLRKQRAREIEDERKRQRAAAAAERKREKEKEAKPQPILDEPVEPSDDQLKAQANSWVFKRLYTDLLIAKGPCHCETKAVRFANNSNKIWSNLVGRIGVGVAFAPLEAFPGVSLAGRLGLGAAKALASHLFGGQSFSEELTKNLFNVIGGEIFPKLTGDAISGSGLNSLAGKALDDLLEAEGARAISWEGKVDMEDCGEVNGKTTMLFNPNTGWVTILIKIEGCPLVVIKYQVNDDGIPINKPQITTIRG